MTQSLTLRRPDDWHLHLRDGAMLKGVLPETARHFARAIIMPNLVPPVVTGAQAASYRDRILAALPKGASFEPLMTLYLTEGTDAVDVAAAAASGLVKAVKLYPAGATTNSHSGVTDFSKVQGVLEKMAEIGLPLCLHGEVTDPSVDIFDREAVFIDTVLDPLRRRIPGLRVVMEHITTEEGVAYARAGGPDLAATITTHHLIINRNAILAGGIRPHFYCLPVAKREKHRLALRAAATRTLRKAAVEGLLQRIDVARHEVVVVLVVITRRTRPLLEALLRRALRRFGAARTRAHAGLATVGAAVVVVAALLLLVAALRLAALLRATVAALVAVPSFLAHMASQAADEAPAAGSSPRPCLSQWRRVKDPGAPSWSTQAGAALLLGVRLCPPCTHLGRLLGTQAILRGFAHSGGIYAQVLETGMVELGSPILLEEGS